ncbi:MAG: 2Fe-2S iron-sulfur cluster binding domain-containing protein [Oceanospirillaceae bacterium]|nr:2Fe-2S iron-sulfur cluster binding domain-containing protein [Oceanospirillaceae bacterium]
MKELKPTGGALAHYRISVTNRDTEFNCKPGQSLLHAMESSARKAIPVGCRCGGCGLCRIRVVEGRYDSKRMSRAHVSEADEACGRVLACRIFPHSDLVIECDFGQATGSGQYNNNEE